MWIKSSQGGCINTDWVVKFNLIQSSEQWQVVAYHTGHEGYLQQFVMFSSSNKEESQNILKTIMLDVAAKEL